VGGAGELRWRGAGEEKVGLATSSIVSSIAFEG